MFEDSLVESQVVRVSASKRWTMAGSTVLQMAIAATLIVIPLMHPERLTFRVETPLVFTPLPPRPPLPVQQQQAAATSALSALPASTTASHSPIFPRNPVPVGDQPPDFGHVDMRMGTGDSIPAVIATGTGHDTDIRVVRAQPAKPHLVSSTGVYAGSLLSPIRPIYPAIARAAGISGTVIVEAVISKTGTIESLRVVSGPQMLHASALDAVRTARYRPYLLNGEPTEIQTTFTINFKIGG
jgi:protein TonB